MTAIAPTTAADVREVPEIRRSLGGSVLTFLRREPVGTLGIVIVLVIAFAGLTADWIAPYNPTSNDFDAMTQAPSWAHLLGTDQFGRDILSRIIFGARTALIVGFGHMRIILRHMVPNVMAPFLIMLTAFVGQAILAEASLSYLGLGVQEPVPAWGLMLQGGAEEYASTAPWIAIFPGLAITATVFGFSLFGDALRDAIDPKLRTR